MLVAAEGGRLQPLRRFFLDGVSGSRFKVDEFVKSVFSVISTEGRNLKFISNHNKQISPFGRNDQAANSDFLRVGNSTFMPGNAKWQAFGNRLQINKNFPG